MNCLDIFRNPFTSTVTKKDKVADVELGTVAEKTGFLKQRKVAKQKLSEAAEPVASSSTQKTHAQAKEAWTGDEPTTFDDLSTEEWATVRGW